MISYVSSMDTVGWFTNNVDDSALLLNILGDNDPRDSSNSWNQRDKLDYLKMIQNVDLKNEVIGIPVEYFIEELDSKIVDTWKESIKLLKDAGAKIKYISLPNSKYGLMTYYIIASAEAASNLR
jgi:aspartyl-tRNA(Asn)/glutamyl-tRNA(Gln) amidotransferase subunit A